MEASAFFNACTFHKVTALAVIKGVCDVGDINKTDASRTLSALQVLRLASSLWCKNTSDRACTPMDASRTSNSVQRTPQVSFMPIDSGGWWWSCCFSQADVLVDRYVSVGARIKSLEEKKEALREDIIAAIEDKRNGNALCGTHMAVVLTETFPSKYLTLDVLAEHDINVPPDKYKQIKEALKSSEPAYRLDVRKKSQVLGKRKASNRSSSSSDTQELEPSTQRQKK